MRLIVAIARMIAAIMSIGLFLYFFVRSFMVLLYNCGYVL